MHKGLPFIILNYMNLLYLYTLLHGSGLGYMPLSIDIATIMPIIDTTIQLLYLLSLLFGHYVYCRCNLFTVDNFFACII